MIVRSLFAICLTAGLLFSTLTLTGCDYLPFGYVTVGEIVSNPTKYEGKRIKVRGVASDVTKIPFLDVKLYVLKDQGSQIMVVAKESIPTAGEKVAVVGIVENVAILGSESIGLHLREIKRLGIPF